MYPINSDDDDPAPEDQAPGPPTIPKSRFAPRVALDTSPATVSDLEIATVSASSTALTALYTQGARGSASGAPKYTLSQLATKAPDSYLITSDAVIFPTRNAVLSVHSSALAETLQAEMKPDPEVLHLAGMRSDFRTIRLDETADNV